METLRSLFACIPSAAALFGLGVMLGAIGGVFVTGLCVAASRNRETLDAMDIPLHSKGIK